ncbi:GNAT family N-acetyltransferase [Streptococcus pneumoniae]
MFNKNFSIQKVTDWEEIKRLDSLIFADRLLEAETFEETIAFLFTLDGESCAFLLGQNSDDFFEIKRLGVMPRYERQGIGTLLLAAVKEEAVANQWKGLILTPHGEEHFFSMNGFQLEVYEESFEIRMLWTNPYRRLE